MILSQNAKQWLHIGNAVHKLREELTSEHIGGHARHQDMLDWLYLCFTEITSRTKVWLVKDKPLIGQEVTCEEL